MLLEFACSNHKSIRDKVFFSMLTGSDSVHEEQVVKINDTKILKSAVIYGANGSGKSNFVNAISFVKNLVSNSILYQPGQGIRYIPHKMSGYESDSTYYIQFLVENIRYVYGFTLNNMLVVDEFLYYHPNGRKTKVFERDAASFKAGSKFQGVFERCKDVLKPNRLLLSCAANFSNVDPIDKVFKFFVDGLVIYDAEIQDDWMNYSLYQMNRNKELKSRVLSILQNFSTGIKDVEVKIDKHEIDSAMLPPFLSDEFKRLILEEKVDSISAKIVYENFETDLMMEESSGIKKLFGLLCPFLDIILNGKVMICDELETNLHEWIVRELVKGFVNNKTNKFPQLIFTTHETGLLGLDLFRRDQIWFTEMKSLDRSTDLYSLAELRNVRKDENFGKGYISGKYGAIPMLNNDFASLIARF